MKKFTRREFLRSSSAMALSAGVLGGLTVKNAFANEVTDYKALVCVFLFGGLDHNDTIIPMDEMSYNLFTQRRSELMNAYNSTSPSSSRNINNLLALNPLEPVNFNGRRYGLPPQMQPLHDLFNQQELAVVGSVGPLVQPVTRQQFEQKNVQLPNRLFSHNDQQSTWMALDVEGAQIGWGGRLLDSTIRNNTNLQPNFMGITTNTTNTFLTGQLSSGFSVAANGGAKINAVTRRGILGGSQTIDNARAQLLAFLERRQFGSSNVFEQDAANYQGVGVENGSVFSDAYEQASPLATAFPSTGLGSQLKTVAETISIRDSLNAKRQVFFVGIGGFDSHSAQALNVPGLQTQIADAIKSFRDAMVEQNMWNDVTLFTASDFGRTLNDNGDGTDHGWGGHHFVAGGSVRGGNIFGHLPSMELTSNDYTDNRGRLIPQVSVEQYAATMGSWFGLDNTELQAQFPNLSNFTQENLGFMR